MKKFLAGLLAPVLCERRSRLSLGRLLLFALTLSLIIAIQRRLDILVTLGAPAASLLAVMYLILSSYCFGQKQATHDVLMTLAGRLPIPGPADNPIQQGVTVVPQAAEDSVDSTGIKPCEK